MNEQRRHWRVFSRQRCWCEAEDLTLSAPLYAPIENLGEGGG